jgi:hypothetical protein
MTEVIGIQSECVDLFWGVVAPMLEPAIIRARGTLTLDSVYNSLISKDMQLWIAISDNEIEAAATTSIINYPAVKVLALPLVGGKNRQNWLQFEPMFIEFGLAHGCTELEGYMRPGWLGMFRKVAKSVLGVEWHPCWTIARKKINK